jgi:hypothetical protein
VAVVCSLFMPGAEQHTHFVAVYPSQDIKPVPGFVFSVPKGWVLDEAPNALAVVRPPEPVDDFWVNVLITSDTVVRSLTIEKAAQITWDRLEKQQPTAAVKTERYARFRDRVTYLRTVDIQHQDGAALSQVQCLFFAPVDKDDVGKTVHMFQIVGTCLAAQLDRLGPDMVEIVASFRFT